MNRALASIAAALLLSTAALPTLAADAAANKPEEAAIPFVNLKASIRDWEADGRDGIWVQDARRDWFYAKLLNPCFGLDFATRVAFVTPGGRLDRFSSVIVEDEPVNCVFTSLTRSDAPPPKKERDAARKAAAKAAKENAAAKPAG
ncbi:MAG: DUF6491 family protein [Steroidobacteraceae bacterium]